MNALSENKKFLTISELKNMGYSYYKIGKLEDEGLISRVNRNTYENLTYKGDENDFFSVEAFVPNGVICLMSAARYYGLYCPWRSTISFWSRATRQNRRYTGDALRGHRGGRAGPCSKGAGS